MLIVVNKSIVMFLYLQTPKSEEEWQEIAKNFVEKWQFPHCLGALDDKHIYIQPQPTEGGCMWHNYKGIFSVLMMAAVDANYSNFRSAESNLLILISFLLIFDG